MPTAETAPARPPAPRVVLADDDVLLRAGVASLLDRSGFKVVGQAGKATELLALVRSVRPELAIIDIRMPPGHATEGLQAARVIREELPGTAIIVLSAHVEVEDAMELLAGGERIGYLLKSRVTDVAEFIETVGRITAGASVVDPSLVQELVRARRREDPLDVLSPREREVLALMAEGASNAGIARRIFVAEGTVAEQAPSLLRMGSHNARGGVIRRQCVRAPGLMLAHLVLQQVNSPHATARTSFPSISASDLPSCLSLTIAHPRGSVVLAGGQPRYLLAVIPALTARSPRVLRNAGRGHAAPGDPVRRAVEQRGAAGLEQCVSAPGRWLESARYS